MNQSISILFILYLTRFHIAYLANFHAHVSLLRTSILKVIILSSEYFTLNSDCITYYRSDAFPQAQLPRRTLSTVVLRVVILWSSSPELLATMVTTSAAGLALRHHIIPLVSAYNEKSEGSQVSLSRYINLGDGTKEKRKYNVPLVNTQDVETLCRCILEFEDVSAPPRLSLTTGPLKFSFFRQCLGGTIRNQWDTLAGGLNETMANFTYV